MLKRKIASVSSVIILGSLAINSAAVFGQQRANKAPTLVQAAKRAFPHGITMTTGAAPGGSQDIQSRLVAHYLNTYLGIPVTVLNQTGGGGIQAFQSVYNARPKSGTITLTYASQLALNYTFTDATLKPTQFTSIARLFGNSPVLMVAAKGSRWTSFATLKSSNATITVGVSGPGGTGTWLAATYLQIFNHLPIQIVPFSSGLAAANAAVGGSIDIAATLVPTATSLIRAGKAQAVVEFGPKSIPALPGIGAIGQLGYPTEEVVEDDGMIGPPKMPTDQVDALNKGILRVLADPAFLSAIATQNIDASWLPARGWSEEVAGFYATFRKHIPALKQILAAG